MPCVEKALMNPHILRIINHALLFQYSELILLNHLAGKANIVEQNLAIKSASYHLQFASSLLF